MVLSSRLGSEFYQESGSPRQAIETLLLLFLLDWVLQSVISHRRHAFHLNRTADVNDTRQREKSVLLVN